MKEKTEIEDAVRAYVRERGLRVVRTPSHGVVVEIFRQHPDAEFSPQEIAKFTGCSNAAAQQHIRRAVEGGIVVRVRMGVYQLKKAAP
jgi:Fic family protein